MDYVGKCKMANTRRSRSSRGMALLHMLQFRQEKHTIQETSNEDSLIKTWETIKNKMYQRTPMWVTPIEVFKHQNLIDWHQIKS